MHSYKFVDGLPDLANNIDRLTVHTKGTSAFIRSPLFIARISLNSCLLQWIIDRQPRQIPDLTRDLPRWIRIASSNFWVSTIDKVIAEILPAQDGGVLVSARDSETGTELWEHLIPVPEAAIWAESFPAWPGARTEEIIAFFASDEENLVVCLARHSRRTKIYSSTATVDTMPPYACQLDATRFDANSGMPIWQDCFPDLEVGLTKQGSFTGIWTNGHRVGVLDLFTGINRVLIESPHLFGSPEYDGSLVVVPWHSKAEVGITWLDKNGNQVRQASWQQLRVSSTCLWPTKEGLAIQINHQSLSWLAKGDIPLWTIRAKPYIYQVHRSSGNDVFVGTDGRGGRLLAFDSINGKETLNLKPALGGVGTLAKVPAHDLLLARFGTSRNDWNIGKLLVLSMIDRTHRLDLPCRSLLSTWQHGAICIAKNNDKKLSIVDLR